MSEVRGCFSWAELVVLIACVALGTAIFAPKFLRADIASDEAQAIADARTVYRAEEAYASANFGFYSDVTNLCRSGPECTGIGIPDYPLTMPEFLPSELGRRSPFEKDGYSHDWTAGGGAYVLPGAADPDSVVGYCYGLSPAVFSSVWPRAFAVDGSGQIYYDPTGAPIACPIPWGTHRLETPRPALAVDFGRRGLWRYDGDDGWIQLAPWDPLLVRAWDESLLATFTGRDGLYLLDDLGWTRIHSRRGTEVVPLVDGLVVRFGTRPGLWHWDQNEWTRITPWDPEAMEAQGNKLLVDFGARGLWLFWKPIGWTMFSDRDPTYIRAGRTDFHADLADGRGVQWIYAYSLSEGEFWSWPTYHRPPEDVLEFRPHRYALRIAYDLGSTRGIWIHNTQVSRWDPYILSVLDDDLVAAVRGVGLYRFANETSWVELSPSEPRELASADTYLGALFDDREGVYRFDDVGPREITRWNAESVTAVDLTSASRSWNLRAIRRCPVSQSPRNGERCRMMRGRPGRP